MKEFEGFITPLTNNDECLTNMENGIEVKKKDSSSNQRFRIRVYDKLEVHNGSKYYIANISSFDSNSDVHPDGHRLVASGRESYNWLIPAESINMDLKEGFELLDDRATKFVHQENDQKQLRMTDGDKPKKKWKIIPLSH